MSHSTLLFFQISTIVMGVIGMGHCIAFIYLEWRGSRS